MRIILFLLLILLILILIFISSEILNQKTKITIFLLGFFILGGIYLFNENKESKANLRNSLIEDFMQGKEIHCNGEIINNVKYNYEYGTSCFIPKREFKDLSGKKIFIEDCER